MRALRILALLLLLGVIASSGPDAAPAGQSPAGPGRLTSGTREPAFSPDGKRLAVIVLDRLWIMRPDGRDARRLTGDDGLIEREPSWSPDGRQIAFSGEGSDGFDIYVVPSNGGVPVRATSLAGPERSPSWASNTRLIFAHRPPQEERGAESSRVTDQWDLYAVDVDADKVWRPAVPLTGTPESETGPAVSPDGHRVLFSSDRLNEDGDTDLWLMDLPAAGEAGQAEPGKLRSVRLTNSPGREGGLSWSPDGKRVSYYAAQNGVASTWVMSVSSSVASAPRSRAAAERVLVSRRAGATTWSRDGLTILIAALPDREREHEYNGDPSRDDSAPPALFGLGDGFRIWSVPAPKPVDDGGRFVTTDLRLPEGGLASAFDRVWQTLRMLYYANGPSSDAWSALRARYELRAKKARDEAELESAIDDMLLEQPLIKPSVVSSRSVVVSAHPLASAAGRRVLEQGGNVVDAAIAVSFALGVVEPDASGIGGDGMAVLFLKGMNEPTVIDYKDQTPIHATLDNPRIFRRGHLVGDGAAAANIPGVVAGLDLMYRRYGSKKIAWSDLISPAIRYANEGYVLDEALPTTIAEGRQFLEKSAEARRVFLPSGRVPRPGDRFLNVDYAATLRALANEGAESFYRGSIARAIAADMTANGGIIGADDLAQYRAIERKPLSGRYRDHLLFSSGPPVPSGERLIETLQILQNYRPAAGARFTVDPDYFHYLIESWKARDPVRRIADPDRWPVEIESHLTEAHASALFRRIERSRATPYNEPAEDDDGQSGEASQGVVDAPDRIGRGTTSFAVADADGNMIAVTQTLSTWGGSYYVSKGLGFLYNNHLRSARTTAGAYGQLLPLVRSSSTSNPTLVFQDRDGVRTPRLAVGAAGNEWITPSVYTIIANVIDGGMPMQRAVEAPRFVVGRDPSDPEGKTALIDIEDRIPRATLEDLMRRGHKFRKVGRKGELRYGYASAVLVDVAAGRVEGGADPRRSHRAEAADGATAATSGRQPASHH